jgi:hypothetical protein
VREGERRRGGKDVAIIIILINICILNEGYRLFLRFNFEENGRS